MSIRPRNGIVPWQQTSPDTQHLLLLPARKAISNTIICCWCDISHIREPNVTNPLIKILFRVYSIIIKQLPMHPDHWYKAIQFQSKATWFRFWWIGNINFSGIQMGIPQGSLIGPFDLCFLLDFWLLECQKCCVNH